MPRVNRNVEKQAELADKAYQEMYGTPTATPVEAPVQQSEPVQAVPLDAPPITEQSAPPMEPAATEISEPTPQPMEESGDINHWKQRAKVAEGRLAKEMPRMAQSIRELKDQLSEAQSRPEPVAAPANSSNDGIKPEEIEQYGAEFIDMVKRAAKSQQAPSVDEGLKKQLDTITEQQRSVARSQFFDTLNRDAPQWEKLNTDQKFLDHLSSLDPYTGRQRQEIFDDAYEKLDAWRIANFFNAYADTQQPQVETPRPSFANQVVPSASKSHSAPPARKIWNTQEVARFYDDVRRGAVNPEQAAQIEQDIFAAQSDGRLR
jgi:hypothetical protein